ncbi:MAG: T9SS type A sorting domain-containing protein [Ignavibacteriales bacterium]|nr:T9SS type A sorting domain-containing protein [Ignavibacteriales bacterium]
MKNVLYYVLFIVLSISINAQTNYYISSSLGNDDNNGLSPDSAFRSLTRINILAESGIFQGGDSILFMRGDEWKGEFLVFGEDANGDYDDPITLSSFGYGAKPIFNGENEFSEFDSSISIGITISSPNFVISNIEIMNYSKDGIHADVGSGKILNLVVDSVFIHNTGSTYFTYVYGIYTEGKNAKILNSFITETYNDGIFMLGANCELGYSRIINAGSGPRGDALQLKYADNFWVHDNIMTSDDLDHGIAITKQREGEGEPEFIGGIFERNYCEGNLWGLDVGGYGTIVRYNQFISNRAYGLKIRGHYVRAYDNFIKNTEQGIALGTPWVTGLVGHIELYNNTIVNTSEFALLLADFIDTVYVSYMNNIFTEIKGIGVKRSRNHFLVPKQCDYNLFYPDVKPGLFISERDSFSTLQQWQLSSEADLHSLSEEPHLIREYYLDYSSPAINAGMDLSYLKNKEYNPDIRGYFRPDNSIWDLGACEYSQSITTTSSSKSGETENRRDKVGSFVGPDRFELSQNYPNPFNPTTKIKYTIPSTPLSFGERLGVRLLVYDILGNEVATLINENQQPGTYEVELNASTLASGVYLYQINAGAFTSSKKMLLTK